MVSSGPLDGKYKDPNIDFIPGCSGKVPYFTQNEARTHMRYFKASKKGGGRPKVYHCTGNKVLSPHWHITTHKKEHSYKGVGK